MSIDLTDPLQLAGALIKCESITPRSAGCMELLQNWLRGLNFKTDILTFGEGPKAIENFLAYSEKSQNLFFFSGHIDVVPVGDARAWTYPPFSAAVADGFLWGRGAADMKSSVAAMIAATARYMAQTRKRPRLMFAFTADEEGVAEHGIRQLMPVLKQKGLGFTLCVNGEPTSEQKLGDTIKIGRRGSFSATITVRGQQGHVAYPHKAQNPVPILLRLLDVLQKIDIHAPYENFDPSNLEITSIDVGNTARNVIPAEARALFNIRYNPAYTHEELEQKIRSLFSERASTNEWTLDVVLPTTPAFHSRTTPHIKMITQVIESICGIVPQLSTSGGTSDARFIQAFGPVVDFGPTNATIHQINERISLDELEKLTQCYTAMIEAFEKTN